MSHKTAETIVQNVASVPDSNSFTDAYKQKLDYITIGAARDLSYAVQMVGASALANGVMGYVPQPLIGDQLHFLRGDGTWVAIPGGGDMLKSVYDPNDDGVIAIGQGGTNATTNTQARINLGVQIGVNVQAWDADLDGLAAVATTGFITRTGAGTFAARTLSAGSTKIGITNGDGILGNPSFDVNEANLTLDNIGGTLGLAKGGTGYSAVSLLDLKYGIEIDRYVKHHFATTFPVSAYMEDGWPTTFWRCEFAGGTATLIYGGLMDGRSIIIKKMQGGAPLVIDGQYGYNINGQATYTLYNQYDEAEFIWDQVTTTWQLRRFASGLTTKGDLLSHNGNQPERIGVGTNGMGLVADSTQATGLRWGYDGGFNKQTIFRQVTADTSIATAVWTPLAALSGNVTPIGSILEVHLGAAISTTGGSRGGYFRLLVNGVVQRASMAQSSANGAMTNVGLIFRAAVTPGVSIPVTIEWKSDGTTSILPASVPDQYFASLIIRDMAA